MWISGAFKSIGTMNVDLTGYVKESDMNTALDLKADKDKTIHVDNVKTTLSDTPSNSNVLSELAIKNLLDGKADSTSIPTVTNDLTDDLKANYDAAYTHSQTTHFDGDYNNLTNKPTIPTVTTTISSSSTDNQVPSAKDVYNKFIVDKVKDYYVIVSSNASLSKYGVDDITTLTGLLSLTSKLENNIRFTIQINNAFKQTFYDNGIIPVNVSGLLVITQLYTRGKAVYITESCQTYVNATGDAKNREWFGWQRLCATTVANVPLTNVTITDENVDTSNGYIRYRVKNGICFVSIYNVRFTKTGQQSFSCNLPKPEGVELYGTHLTGSGNGENNGYMYMKSGQSAIYVVIKTTGNSFGSFSYPVAES